MHIINLRSDTVTQPTQAMREAMYRAEVGDDVMGDDPTINRLEKEAAEVLGKEAAMFVPSGTMGNQVSLMAHTQRGDAVISGEGYHIVSNEAGGHAVMSAVCANILPTIDGRMAPEDIQAALTDDSNVHIPQTGLISLENATSMGTVVPLSEMEEIYRIGQRAGIPVHLDGARLFNAATALGVDVKEITQYCDSVMCCLSKGLCAPVGSMVAGSKQFIHRARRHRKMLGGGMRQAGFLAAAGLIALHEMPKHLATDHANAKYLAGQLNQIEGFEVEMNHVDIDMVFFTTTLPETVLDRFPKAFAENNINAKIKKGVASRFVTNHDVSKEDIDTVIDVIKNVIQSA
ncbi:MAG: low-specificity L-threonine aldolase [Clostridiales bacterium]|nr:low-specificity L-threonine aldolase [Clostridiales bacterium]